MRTPPRPLMPVTDVLRPDEVRVTETSVEGVAAADAGSGVARDRRRWFVLACILAANVLVFSGVIIMNVALPAAQDDLGLGVSERQWVVTLYALTFGGFILLGGRLGDAFGLRRATVTALAAYAVASAVGAAAPTGGVLLGARAGQGLAAAVVAACALALLSRTFPSGADRERAFGVLGLVMGLGGAGAFVVGGALTEVSWRGCLAIGVPIAVLAAVGLQRSAPADGPLRRRRFDLVGAVLVTSGVALMILGFDRAAAGGWSSWPTLVPLAAGAMLITAFVAVERRRADAALIPLTVVTDGARAGAYLSVLLLGLALFAGLFLLTFYLQDVLGYSPVVTGLAFLPFGVAAMVASRIVGPASRRWSSSTVLVVGLLSTAAGAGLLTQLDGSTSYVTGVVPAFALYGLGATAVMVTASNRATLGAGEHTGIASAAVGASQQIGGAFGTGLLSSIAVAASASYERAHGLEAGDVGATVHGLTRASAVGAAVVVVGAVVVLVLATRTSTTGAGATDRPSGLVGHDE